MRIARILWREVVVQKIAAKHDVTPQEVREVLTARPHVRRVEKGLVQYEDLYVALGETSEGRHLAVFFIRKRFGDALIVTARDMTRKERRLHDRR